MLGDNHWCPGWRRRRGNNLLKGLAANEGEVLLHGEPWRSGDREILINWKKKKDFKINSKEIKIKKIKKKILINGEK